MSQINKGDIVWVVSGSTVKTALLVRVRQVYPPSVTDPDYLVQEYPNFGRSWYATQQELRPLTPEEQLQLVTFGRILKAD